jgi:hypothetical protein
MRAPNGRPGAHDPSDWIGYWAASPAGEIFLIQAIDAVVGGITIYRGIGLHEQTVITATPQILREQDQKFLETTWEGEHA